MSLKEFTARCSAITLITASSYGIALAAQPPAPRPSSATQSSAPAYSSAVDNSISTQVSSALSASNIGGVLILTEQGVVMLSGTVANEDLRQQAARIAAAVDGVRGVDFASLAVHPKA